MRKDRNNKGKKKEWERREREGKGILNPNR